MQLIRPDTAVNMVLYADIWQYGGCLSFGLICHSYNRDFFTGCEVKAEAFTRVWVELGGSVHYPLVKLLLLGLYKRETPVDSLPSIVLKHGHSPREKQHVDGPPRSVCSIDNADRKEARVLYRKFIRYSSSLYIAVI